ncbi:integrase core domain-containing protein [Rhodococcus marinonascens]|uniref:integrase core domain-containing protein n=1 Tax=Rhodococcus marinonascens TaxID=38311 RepID=UPI000A06BB60
MEQRAYRVWGHLPGRSPWGINNRLRKECLNQNHWTSLLEARVVIGDLKDDHNQRHHHSSLGCRTLPDAPTPIHPWAVRSTDSNSTWL